MTKHLCLAIAVWGLSAHAYHIEEHRLITDQAFQELAHCFSRAEALLNVAWMEDGNIEEDTDLFSKWLFYSHYYNPNKQLDMRRYDSAERVSGLSSDLRNPSTNGVDIKEMTDLGHMIHHFQDASVPSHVVPVDHSLWDGFETYKVKDYSSGLTCDQIAAFANDVPLVILKETALETLSNIRNFTFDFVSLAGGAKNRVTASGPAFWQESSDNEFGQYGYLGNHFGITSFNESSVDYQIADESYQTFKKVQLQLAVKATIRGLMWEIGDQLKKIQFVCEPSF